MSKDSNAKIFSIVGGCRRSGRWLVPAKNNMMTLFGRAFIDLREAQTDADELEFTCLSVFANVTFIVPEGAEVRPSGMAVLGSSKCIVPVTDQPCHLPPISVDATTVFGRLRVRTTETDPEDIEGRRRFRRRRRARPEEGSEATENVDQSEAVRVVDVPASRGVDPVDFRAPGRAAPPAVFADDDDDSHDADGAFDPGAPIPPFVDEDDPAPATAPERTDDPSPIAGSDDEPAPNGGFGDDRSPLADVSVPDTIEGAAEVADDDESSDVIA